MLGSDVAIAPTSRNLPSALVRRSVKLANSSDRTLALPSRQQMLCLDGVRAAALRNILKGAASQTSCLLLDRLLYRCLKVSSAVNLTTISNHGR